MSASPLDTVASMESLHEDAPREARASDSESREWLAALHGEPRRREDAIDRLHALLLRAARFEIVRRRSALANVRGEELDDLATQAAADALMAILGKLDQYRGESRFTSWAYKFALLEASVKVRRRAWRDREVPLDFEAWTGFADQALGPEAAAEGGELIEAVREGIAERLTTHQRNVLVAVALEGVPIDVLAQRLGTTRGALYKTLHDARRKLRAELARQGLAIRPQHSTQGGA